MKVVNFFGAPGSGKSTAAGGLYDILKRNWVDCELVREYAKELIWGDCSHLLQLQNWVFANQERLLNQLDGKVDIAVSDAPLLISAFYAPKNYPESFTRLCFDLFNRYDNINYFINRSHDYVSNGRLQNQQESDDIGADMKAFLKTNGVSFIEVTAGDATPRAIFRQLAESGVFVPIQGSAYDLWHNGKAPYDSGWGGVKNSLPPFHYKSKS